jgi:hypothetical protein
MSTVSGTLMASCPPIFSAVPPRVSTQNFLCASTLVTLRWKWPTMAGASLFESWAPADAPSAQTKAATATVNERRMRSS